jgi:hypothetical protein
MKIVMNPIRPALCAGIEDFHLLVRLQPEVEPGFKRTPLNLALVIDRSGLWRARNSMRQNAVR